MRSAAADIDLMVFDILGTLVNEPGGLHDSIRALAPTGDAGRIDHLVGVWQSHVADQQRKILEGHRPFVNSDVLDREAAELVAAECNVTNAEVIASLATALRRLPPWSDTLEALERLGQHFPVIGLSNASRATLTRLNAHAGLRWHYLLSAEDARSYKPAPGVYGLALDITGGEAPERVLMVAAHAWDLRGAQVVGLRTAYVHRPVGDPPLATDKFDFHAASLSDLADAILDP